MENRVAVFYGSQGNETKLLGVFVDMKSARKAYEPLEDGGDFVRVLDLEDPIYASDQEA